MHFFVLFYFIIKDSYSKSNAAHKELSAYLNETILSLQCVAIQVKSPSLCLFSLTLSIMKGLAKTLSTSHYLSDNRFLKESFVEASLAMASLCGLNAGHIWSNYLTRKQLSVILKGEGFQLINLLNPLVLLPFPRKLWCLVWLRRVLSGEKDITCACCTGLQQVLCSLVCKGFQGLNWE